MQELKSSQHLSVWYNPTFRRVFPLAAAAAILIVLVVPILPATGGRLRTAVETVAHFLLFVALGWCVVTLTPWSARAWRVVMLTMAGLVAVAVLVRGLSGRGYDVTDMGLSFAGGVAGVMATAAWRGGSRWRIAIATAVVAALSAAAVAPVVLILADRVQAYLSFPLLASFEGPSEVGRWWEHHCRLSRVTTQATQGKFALRVVLFKSRGSYPGLFMTDGRRDWSGYSRLCLDVYLTGNAERSLWVRADDRPGQPPYSDRAQTLVNLAPGPNSVCLDLATFLRTPEGRELDRHRIVQLGLFLDEAQGGETFYLDNVRLTR